MSSQEQMTHVEDKTQNKRGGTKRGFRRFMVRNRALLVSWVIFLAITAVVIWFFAGFVSRQDARHNARTTAAIAECRSTRDPLSCQTLIDKLCTMTDHSNCGTLGYSIVESDGLVGNTFNVGGRCLNFDLSTNEFSVSVNRMPIDKVYDPPGKSLQICEGQLFFVKK